MKDYGITIVNIKKTQEYDMYMGRENPWLDLKQSKWANPFPMKNEGEREFVLASYEKHIKSSPELIKALPELIGKKLGCYCAPKKCHCDILVEIMNELDIEYIPEVA